ncbi:MAG: hypothetical protein ABIP03_12910 [Aquihabitans sp.]
MFGSKKRKAENLMATGSKAVGTISSVRDTGMTVNDNPRVELSFTIQPLDGGPSFESSKTVTVSRVRIPQAGQRYPVWFDAQDHQQFAYASEVDAEGRGNIVALFGDAFGPDGSGVGQIAPAAASPSADDVASRIRKLDELLAAGAIGAEEHGAQKLRIVDSI